SIEYDRTSNDRLVFRGVEIVPGINLGLVEANRAGRDTAVATLAARFGVTNRLEVEARVPYVYRNDQVTTVATQTNNFEQNSSLYGHDIGDVEFAARYQLNYGRDGWPIFVATGRVKPPTGKGPYDVAYDANAVALQLPTGSGFWGVEGGVTMLYPTDPAIIFASLTYLHNFSRNIDKTFGQAGSALHVGEVDPGDSIGATLGFGLSLNPRFSVSFGYSHNYIFATTAHEGSPGAVEIRSKSQPLQAGSLLMGWSFRLSDRLTLNNSFEFGVTSDAPDLQIVFRAPYRF
ncbi:MAG: transporter, partial [Caulobacterales bacterium]